MLGALLVLSTEAVVSSHLERLMTLIQRTPPLGALPYDARLALEVARCTADLVDANPEACPSFPRDLMMVDGRWSLIYTSTGTSLLEALPEAVLPPELPEPLSSALGGALSGSPLKPQQVSQLIDVTNRRILMEMEVEVAHVELPGPLPFVLSSRRFADRLVPSYSIPPPLRPAVSGSFDTIYVDESLRICRGGELGGELRIFERQGGAKSGQSQNTDDIDARGGQVDPWASEPVLENKDAGMDDMEIEELWDEATGQWITPDVPSD
ncbi:MAG: hypothetical protein SGPRY_009353 [Prymnesium sp.]